MVRAQLTSLREPKAWLKTCMVLWVKMMGLVEPDLCEAVVQTNGWLVLAAPAQGHPQLCRSGLLVHLQTGGVGVAGTVP